MREKLVRIAICDDEFIIQRIVKGTCEEYLKKHNVPYELELFKDGISLLQCKKPIDILFLDIEMPGMDGFEIAGEVNKKFNNVSIIFLTNHVEMIQKAFAVKAFRYLFKPINENDFFEALEDAINEFFHVQHVILEQKGACTLIEIRKIMYIESLGDETVLYTKEESIVNSNSLKKWMLTLDHINFFQSHKSYVVNLAFIKNIEKGKVVLKNDRELPVSVRNRKLIKEKMYEYIKEKARYM